MHFYICISEYIPQLHLPKNGTACPAVLLNTFLFSYSLILKLNSGMWSCIILYVYRLICDIKTKNLFPTVLYILLKYYILAYYALLSYVPYFCTIQSVVYLTSLCFTVVFFICCCFHKAGILKNI